MVLSSDDKFVAAAGADRRIFVWDVASGELVHTLGGHRDAVYSLRFNRPGTHLLSGGHTGSLLLWNLQDGSRNALSGKVPGVAYSAAFAPDRKQALVSGANGNAYFVPLPDAAQ